MALADYLLAAQGWDRNKIGEKVKSHERKEMVLENPIPVHLVYMTAWADDDGTIHFFHDLYGRDQRLQEELSASDDARPTFAADLMPIDRILEMQRDTAASKAAGKIEATRFPEWYHLPTVGPGPYPGYAFQDALLQIQFCLLQSSVFFCM